jgi:hypothetical protein
MPSAREILVVIATATVCWYGSWTAVALVLAICAFSLWDGPAERIP